MSTQLLHILMPLLLMQGLRIAVTGETVVNYTKVLCPKGGGDLKGLLSVYACNITVASNGRTFVNVFVTFDQAFRQLPAEITIQTKLNGPYRQYFATKFDFCQIKDMQTNTIMKSVVLTFNKFITKPLTCPVTLEHDYMIRNFTIDGLPKFTPNLEWIFTTKVQLVNNTPPIVFQLHGNIRKMF